MTGRSSSEEGETLSVARKVAVVFIAVVTPLIFWSWNGYPGSLGGALVQIPLAWLAALVAWALAHSSPLGPDSNTSFWVPVALVAIIGFVSVSSDLEDRDRARNDRRGERGITFEEFRTIRAGETLARLTERLGTPQLFVGVDRLMAQAERLEVTTGSEACRMYRGRQGPDLGYVVCFGEGTDQIGEEDRPVTSAHRVRRVPIRTSP